ncbi:MAG TPA: hypothetical protein VGR14_20460 [Verrucomicrobiae bacterium]|jgi:hypothetical protein|nr:hypothetical protein [Verrucomicrobiae bacterium]
MPKPEKTLRPRQQLPVIPKVCLDSQKRAWDRLINKACGMVADADGQLNPDQFFLDMVASRGTAFGDWSLRQFLGGIMVVKYKNQKPNDNYGIAFSEDSIWASEERLNSFLKRLGRVLEQTKDNPKPLWVPEWRKNVDLLDELVVRGWCEKIVVHGYHWPPLCCLTFPAMFKFLCLCDKPMLSETNSDLEAFRQRIRRLGLVSLPKGKVSRVEKDQHGNFLFA